MNSPGSSLHLPIAPHMLALEILSNAAMTVSIFLAARNSVHTWWTGIVACVMFAALFAQAKLYADVTLQAFFVATSIAGWQKWRVSRESPAFPISRAGKQELLRLLIYGLAGAVIYGWLLHRLTDAYAPFLDSLVLTLSVAAQLLLMKRQIETWWFWLGVNLIAAPLFFSRELYITAALYAAYFVNALIALRHWETLLQRQSESRP